MKYLFLSLLLWLIASAPAGAQRIAKPSARLNPPLKQELDSMYVQDQIFREALIDPAKTKQRDSLAQRYQLPANNVQGGLMSRMIRTDSSNLQRVRAIIKRFGYPGKSLVGTPTNEAAFYVIQHSSRIPEYLPLIKQAAEQGELPFRLYAMMLDRQLMYAGQPQVYGTQGRSFPNPNPTEKQQYFIWPIADPAHVNERRRQAGFDQTVEENAARLNIPYQVLTIEEVEKMPGYKK
ncbi:DUF6624 domain-containing protein [Hymenobacter psoromatis]|uniref:DUF6624 domain-containing protein n=1 Tax=Hymenobacter psoromatis TaxID=1484116 RepID=UPI001CBD2F33|nr:DUF6624 domain-containing protein [Hymenobacter psoromatis]